MTELPRGTVTFLFTDLESSTDLVRQLGESYADLLGEHRRLLRAAFAEHGGREIDTQGDAFFIAFDRVGDAVRAAVAAQRALAAHEWPSERPRIRVGLHTSEPHVWEDGYVGVGVHRAHRICQAGHGGQVLLSRSTAGLAADQDLEGIGLRDLGEHRLKGLDRPERIFQLVVAGLQNDFPPLDTIEGAGLATETLTVLSTDAEAFTRRARLLPPATFRALVAEYHRTLQSVLEESGGRGILTVADSASAVYRSARQAVLAAADLQRNVHERTWPDGDRVGLTVGLDSGELVATAHGYFGVAVNRAFLLSGMARGGHVLLSDATRSLLAGEDLGDLELLDLGEHPLRVDDRPSRIYQLIVPGLPQKSPPLQAAAPARHQL